MNEQGRRKKKKKEETKEKESVTFSSFLSPPPFVNAWLKQTTHERLCFFFRSFLS